MPPDPEDLLAMFAAEDNERIQATIDANSNNLILEFTQHLAEVRRFNPTVSERVVYEGWMIQKMSALQVLLLEMNARLNLIASHTRKRSTASW